MDSSTLHTVGKIPLDSEAQNQLQGLTDTCMPPDKLMMRDQDELMYKVTDVLQRYLDNQDMYKMF